MDRNWRPILLLVGILAVIVAGASLLKAGPLSDVEVANRLHGIPTAMQAVACSTTSATASNAIPQTSLLRIAIEGTGGVYYDFVAQGGSVSYSGATPGVYLANGLSPEFVQNGANQYFACVVRSTSVTVSLAVMR